MNFTKQGATSKFSDGFHLLVMFTQYRNTADTSDCAPFLLTPMSAMFFRGGRRRNCHSCQSVDIDSDGCPNTSIEPDKSIPLVHASSFSGATLRAVVSELNK